MSTIKVGIVAGFKGENVTRKGQLGAVGGVLFTWITLVHSNLLNWKCVCFRHFSPYNTCHRKKVKNNTSCPSSLTQVIQR